MIANRLICVLAGLAIAVHAFSGIGDRLERTYFDFQPLPITVKDATNQGWIQVAGNYCDPNLGYAYSLPNPDQGNFSVLTLYYSGGGQISGLAVWHIGQPISKYWIPDQYGDYWFIQVGFRNASQGICSQNQFEEPLGTQVLVNPGYAPFEIPLTTASAIDEKWTYGSCVKYMGRHWPFDVVAAPDFTYEASNLYPVVPMYNNVTNMISSFFITTPVPQKSLEWDGGPISSSIMCGNWCDSSCKWAEPLWNTFHFFVTDHTLNICDDSC